MQRSRRNASVAEKALRPASGMTVLPGAREWDRPKPSAFVASLAISTAGCTGIARLLGGAVRCVGGGS